MLVYHPERLNMLWPRSAKCSTTLSAIGCLKETILVSSVKIPRADNKRIRFLTLTEARELLTALKARNKSLYGMALLSLHSGLRAGEILALRWVDVDFERKALTLKDTKSGRTRTAFLTADGISMLRERNKNRSPEDFVFQGKGGKMLAEIPRIFNMVVNDLRLNEGITDRRQKVVFHTLRHTYASWLVEQGVDLYTVKELLGHCTIGVTERYAHISNGTLLKAVRTLESAVCEDKCLDSQ